MDSPMSLGSLPRVGETVDRYEVVAEIASGGMAVVYAVRRKGIGGFDKLLALKLILPHLAVEERFVQMMLDEARIASQIHHPNVVQVFDVGDANGSPFMVMEFLRGHSLARVVKKSMSTDVRMPPGFTLAVLARAAEGLHAAHETLGPDGEPFGIVHRDVSPQNFHVCYNGQVKVVDFGIAAARGKLTMTRTGELKGKLSYLAPEQLSRAYVDRRADVWALGVVAWEMLAGKRLFRTDEEATTLDNILRMPIPDLRAYAPDLPTPVYAALAACLERNVDRRLDSTAQLARAFADAGATMGCPHATDIAAYMNDLFATEKALEQERLAAAVAGPRPIRGEEPDTGSMPFTPAPHQPTTGAIAAPAPMPVAVAPPTSSPLRHLLWVAPVLGAVVVGACVAWFVGGDDPGAAPPAPTVIAASPTTPPADVTPPAGAAENPAPTETPEIETATISVEVDPRAHLALVDGVRVETRPIRIDLGPTDSATVELFYANGESLRRVVRATDDGIRIGPEARSPDRSADRTRTGTDARAGRSSGAQDTTPASTRSTSASATTATTRSAATTPASGRTTSTTSSTARSASTSTGRGGSTTTGTGRSGSTTTSTGRSGSTTTSTGRGRGGGSPLLGSPY